MPQFRAALAALVLALACAAHAKRAAPAKPSARPAVDCKTLSDSLVKLYDAGDPTYLTWDFAEAHCDSAQLYLAYYYQGIGFEFISAWKEALYFLNAAREIGGPKDEEILYHLWMVYRKLDRYSEMERLTLELHRRYPNSLFLFEIIDQWKSVKAPSRIAWNYSARAGISSTHYLTDQLTDRVQAETRQQSGPHRFREHASVSLASKWNASDWNQRLVHGFQANLGGEYAYKGLTAEADWGAGYATPTKDSVVHGENGQPLMLADSNWNFVQGHLGLGYSYTTAAGWSFGANAGALLLSKDWRVLDLSHTESFLFNDVLLIGYLDFQRHWIGAAPDSLGAEAGTLGLDGLYTFTATATPYFTFGRHSLGAGPSYYFEASHYSGSYAGARQSEKYREHTLSGMATYDFDLRRWCRFTLTGSYGVEMDKGFGAAKYSSKRVFSADIGASLSF
jgi:hypothetical protein